MQRSEEYTQGYRAAVKDAVQWLHGRADSMNDPNARAVLNVAAHDLGIEAKSACVIPNRGRSPSTDRNA